MHSGITVQISAHISENLCVQMQCVRPRAGLISIAAAGCVVYKPQERFYHTLLFAYLILVDTYALQHIPPTDVGEIIY